MVGLSIVLASLCLLSSFACAYPDLATRDDSSQGGKKIVLPTRTNDTGLKQIPGKLFVEFDANALLIGFRNADAAHPFRAPGPNDQRGPCRKSLYI